MTEPTDRSSSRPRRDATKFINDAKKVRDYGLQYGLLPDDSLIDALIPFEVDPANSDPHAVAALQKAVRQSYAAFDKATLRDILSKNGPSKGNDAPKRIGETLTQMVIVSIGILLFILAYHYTNWSKRAHLVVANIEEMTGHDYLNDFVSIGQSMQAVDINDGGDAARMPDLENAEVLLVIEKLDDFLALQFKMQDTFVRASNLMNTVHPVKNIAARASKAASWTGDKLGSLFELPNSQEDPPPPSGGTDEGNKTTPSGSTGAQNAPSNDATADTILSQAKDQQAISFGALSHAKYFNENIIGGFMKQVNGPMTASNSDIISSFSALENRKNELINLTEITDRWSLPAIYGALGAAIYVLVRYISTYIPNPKFGEAFLRMVFGGFIGITVSMLFSPNNIGVLSGAGGPSVLLLACLVLGYSIGTFISLLERIDNIFRTPEQQSPPQK